MGRRARRVLAMVGEVLDGIEGIVALHDRKVPGGRANIDHIAITPAGIWVIDPMRNPDKQVELRDVGGWFRTDERSWSADETTPSWSTQWSGRSRRSPPLRTTCSMASRSVHAVFRRIDLGLVANTFRVRGVAVCWPTALPEILTRPGDFDGERIDAIARRLAKALPPAEPLTATRPSGVAEPVTRHR